MWRFEPQFVNILHAYAIKMIYVNLVLSYLFAHLYVKCYWLFLIFQVEANHDLSTNLKGTFNCKTVICCKTKYNIYRYIVNRLLYSAFMLVIGLSPIDYVIYICTRSYQGYILLCFLFYILNKLSGRCL